MFLFSIGCRRRQGQLHTCLSFSVSKSRPCLASQLVCSLSTSQQTRGTCHTCFGAAWLRTQLKKCACYPRPIHGSLRSNRRERESALILTLPLPIKYEVGEGAFIPPWQSPFWSWAFGITEVSSTTLYGAANSSFVSFTPSPSWSSD